MSSDRSKTDDPHIPNFYLPATAPTAKQLGRIGKTLASLFRRRGGIRADRRSNRTDR
ncbi:MULTISPECIES: hypothetical protein [Natronorubrum]|uniref:hypothetical protein n=1 Tax=Natronorubrum TaxID=134813 RepID=UPI000B1743A3|nr:MULTISPECIES: hypothetical protein [Natronorubrum]